MFGQHPGSGRACQEGQESSRDLDVLRYRHNPRLLPDRFMPVAWNNRGSWPAYQQRIGGEDHVGITAVEQLQRLPHIFAEDNLGADAVPQVFMFQRLAGRYAVGSQLGIGQALRNEPNFGSQIVDIDDAFRLARETPT